MIPRITPDPTDLNEIPIKRFYLPFILTAPCAQCGKDATSDLMRDGEYLSYPATNTPIAAWVYCEPCRRETRVGLMMTFSIVGCEPPPEAPEVGEEE